MSNPEDYEVKDTLRTLREQRGLSPEALSKIAGVSNIHIRRIESGERHNITLKMASRLAKALQVSPTVFFTDSRRDQPRDIGFMLAETLQLYKDLNISPVPVRAVITKKSRNDICPISEVTEYISVPVSGLPKGIIDLRDLFAVKINRDLMSASKMNNQQRATSFQIVDPNGNFEIGGLYYVLHNNELLMVKFAKQGTKTYFMHGTHLAAIQFSDVAIRGRAVMSINTYL